MQQSEQINELAEALAKAQGKMQNAKKDSTNPHFKSNYADLAAIVTALRIPLSENSLTYVQTTLVDEAGNVTLVTTLAHKSGQWVRSYYPVRPVQANPQGFGSALTYARRYSLAAIAGVAAENEDDDGNAASAGSPLPPPAPKAVKSQQQTSLDSYNEHKAQYAVEAAVLANGSLDFDGFVADLESLLPSAKSMNELSLYKKANARVLNLMKDDRPDLFEHVKEQFTQYGNALA
ncbi:MAG: ERF family protein [Planctomycetes bacterium]|nr:ERF family protein [Planctomycetota bacterium]